MRMRKKTNLVPRMEACSQYWIQEPETYKGRWRELMPACKELRANTHEHMLIPFLLYYKL